MNDTSVPDAIVIDNGTASCKVGVAGEESPACVIPTVVSRWTSSAYIGSGAKWVYVGEEAEKAPRGLYTRKRPIEQGIITHMDSMESIWHHAIYEKLQMDPERYPILMTEDVLNPPAVREKTAQVVFETFGAPAFYMLPAPVCTLMACGMDTGLVVESGEGGTQVVPVYFGHTMRYAVVKTDFGGKAVTESLLRLLKAKEKLNQSPVDVKIAQDIKEKMCSCASMAPKEECGGGKKPRRSFTLPDGNVIDLDEEDIHAPGDVMFRSEETGLHRLMVDNWLKMEVDDRYCYINDKIAMGGGNAMLHGFADRLRDEIVPLLPGALQPRHGLRFTSPSVDDLRLTAWIGGSILASLTTFRQTCITKQEYEEWGPRIVNTKCF